MRAGRMVEWQLNDGYMIPNNAAAAIGARYYSAVAEKLIAELDQLEIQTYPFNVDISDRMLECLKGMDDERRADG